MEFDNKKFNNIIKMSDYLDNNNELPSFSNSHNKKNKSNKTNFKNNKIYLFDFLKLELTKSQIISLVLLFVVIVFVFIFFRFRKFNDINVSWKYYYTSGDKISSGNIKYLKLKNSIIRYTNDGITLVDNDGYLKWSFSYNLKNPIIEKQNEYFAISSIGENVIYIFNESGLLTEIDTKYPIQKVDISNIGTVFVMLDGGDSNFINVYDKTGKELDIVIKSLLSADGIPIDFSISNDGTQVIVSFGYIDNNKFNTRVVIYNFDDVGKNVGSSRIVGGFDNEFKNKFVSRVKFIDNVHSVCFYDGGLAFFSTKIQFSPKIIKNITTDNIIKSIAYNENYVAIISDVKNDNDDIKYELRVFDLNGNELMKNYYYNYYDNFIVLDKKIALTYENRLIIYSFNNSVILDKEFNDSIYYINNKKQFVFDEYYLCTENYVECMSLIY